MGSADTPGSPVETARQLYRQKKVAQAVNTLKAFLEQKPGDRDALELLGTCYFVLKQLDEARTTFEQLTKSHASHGPGWVNLGAVQNALQDYMGASKSLRKALQKDKKCAAAHYNLGIAQKALKMNSMAITAYREAIRLAPTMPEPYANLSNIYIEMKNVNQAIKCLDEGLGKCPNHPKLTAILKKAQAEKSGLKAKEAPLGRLVDEKELSQRTLKATRKELQPADRNRERESLREITRGIRRLMKPVPVMIDEGLQKQLHSMNLAAAQNDPRCEAPGAFEQMTETLAEMERIRSETTAAMGRILAHFRETDPEAVASL